VAVEARVGAQRELPAGAGVADPADRLGEEVAGAAPRVGATLAQARTPDGAVLYEGDAMATDILSSVANRYLGARIAPVDRVFESLDGTRYAE
jgi:hypothetical protein